MANDAHLRHVFAWYPLIDHYRSMLYTMHVHPAALPYITTNVCEPMSPFVDCATRGSKRKKSRIRYNEIIKRDKCSPNGSIQRLNHYCHHWKVLMKKMAS